ncbi:hypothetical protein HK104_008318 [Borealophlyctis nickersoniae]|nr:hypothetical protein HK104_008318 [Borealophlyctis nickersoniae]
MAVRKVPQKLRTKAQSLGLPMTGTKAEIIYMIYQHVARTLSTPPPESIIAIDIGSVRMAVVHISVREAIPRILDWFMLNLQFPTQYDPRVFADECSRILPKIPEAPVCLVEAQYYPTTWIEGRALLQLPQGILNIRAIEGMLVGMLMQRQTRGSGMTVESIKPAMVSKHFHLNLNSEKKKHSPDGGPIVRSGNRYRLKKTSAVQLVSKWLEDGERVDCPPRLRDDFFHSKKKDDLSDSLLIAVAWADWWQASENELQHFRTKQEESPNFSD